jgi:hypothetical protein
MGIKNLGRPTRGGKATATAGYPTPPMDNFLKGAGATLTVVFCILKG